MKQHGGKRPGSGRKKVKDKVLTLTIYPRTSMVKKAGGLAKAKELCLSVLSEGK